MKKDDIVTSAITKAQSKLAMPEDKKIAANIQSLYKRLVNAYEKLTDAKAQNSNQVDILKQSVNKLKNDIDKNRKALRRLREDMAPTDSKHDKLDKTNNNSSSLNDKHRL